MKMILVPGCLAALRAKFVAVFPNRPFFQEQPNQYFTDKFMRCQKPGQLAIFHVLTVPVKLAWLLPFHQPANPIPVTRSQIPHQAAMSAMPPMPLKN